MVIVTAKSLNYFSRKSTVHFPECTALYGYASVYATLQGGPSPLYS